MVAGGELGRASGVGDCAATSVSPRFSTNSIAKVSLKSRPSEYQAFLFSVKSSVALAEFHFKSTTHWC